MLKQELRQDVTVREMGNFRWLTVGLPGQSDSELVLMEVPGPPVFDNETRDQIRDLMAKGGAGDSSTPRMAAGPRTRSSRVAGSSSSRSRRSSPTASRRDSATRQATRSASRS